MRAAQVPIDGRLHASRTRPSACTGHITGGDDDGGDDDDNDDDDNDDDDDDGDDDDDDDFICQTFCRLAIVLPLGSVARRRCHRCFSSRIRAAAASARTCAWSCTGDV